MPSVKKYLSSSDNLALGRTTWQSTTYTDGQGNYAGSSRAVDGDNEGVYWTGNTCTYTQPADRNPWWAVDLGGLYEVTYVVVWNRANHGEYKRVKSKCLLQIQY